MNRAEAFDLVREYTQNPSLIKHMLAVEAAMRAYARKLGEDEERCAGALSAYCTISTTSAGPIPRIIR